MFFPGLAYLKQSPKMRASFQKRSPEWRSLKTPASRTERKLPYLINAQRVYLIVEVQAGASIR